MGLSGGGQASCDSSASEALENATSNVHIFIAGPMTHPEVTLKQQLMQSWQFVMQLAALGVAMGNAVPELLAGEPVLSADTL